MTIFIIVLVAGLLTYAAGEKLYQWHVARQATGSVTVTLTVDTTQFTEELARASAAARRLGERFGLFKQEVGEALLPPVTRMIHTLDIQRVRAETKWYVRGSMYAALGWPETCVNEEVRNALAEEFLFPTVAAAAFMRGWVENRPDDPQVAAARALPLDPHPMYDELVTP